MVATTEHGTDPLAVLARVPSLAGTPRVVTALSGGLTNHNFKVTTPDGVFVARMFYDGGELLGINREHEYRNSVIAAAAGVGAPVIEYRPPLRRSQCPSMHPVIPCRRHCPAHRTRVRSLIRASPSIAAESVPSAAISATLASTAAPMTPFSATAAMIEIRIAVLTDHTAMGAGMCGCG